MVGFQRDVDELAVIGNARDRFERGLRIGGVPRDAAQGTDLVHASERRRSNGVVRRLLGDGRQLARIVETLERERRFPVVVRWRCRHRHQTIGYGPFEVFVFFAASDPHQVLGKAQSRDGSPAHPQIGILGRQLQQHASVVPVVRDLRDSTGP